MIKVRTEPEPRCKLCSVEGNILYTGIKDIIGTTAGEWILKKCPRCGLIWLDPMPKECDISLAYSEYPTHESASTEELSVKERIKLGYLKTRYGFNPQGIGALYKVLGLLLWLFPFKRVSSDFWFRALGGMPNRGRLLDIGCGNGDLISMMNDWGWQAEGIEPDYKAVENARKRGLKVIQGDFLKYDFTENSFDAIVSSHVFEHVFDPIEFLRKCYWILKPNGIMCIATPNTSSWQHHLFKENWMALDAPRHLYLFNPLSLRLCSEKAGIRNYKITTTSRGSRFIASASLLVKQKGSYHWKDNIDFKTALLSNILEVLEYILVFYKKEAGVELLFTAYKK